MWPGFVALTLPSIALALALVGVPIVGVFAIAGSPILGVALVLSRRTVAFAVGLILGWALAGLGFLLLAAVLR